MRISIGAAVMLAGVATLNIASAAERTPHWAGFYIGAHGGLGVGQSNVDASFLTEGAAIGSNPGDVLARDKSTISMTNAIAGGQIGYNWQSGTLVYGAETDVAWSNQKGSGQLVCPVPNVGQGCNELIAANMDGLPPTAYLDQRLRWFGTARGRIGITARPDTLVYATGGLAFGQLDTDGVAVGYGVNTIRYTLIANSSMQWGWTAGMGVERQIIGNWLARLEYLYVDLGTARDSVVVRNFPNLNFVYDTHLTNHIMRAGISYSFGDNSR